MNPPETRPPDEEFERHRRRLFGLAYRMLSLAADAEDVVRDAYLKWIQAHAIEVPRAWLTKVVANLCLNRLSSARAKRESYSGPWLPEPVLTDDGTLGPLDAAEQRESVALGVLILLERLSPAERSVFVLSEARRKTPPLLLGTFLGAAACGACRRRCHLAQSRRGTEELFAQFPQALR